MLAVAGLALVTAGCADDGDDRAARAQRRVVGTTRACETAVISYTGPRLPTPSGGTPAQAITFVGLGTEHAPSSEERDPTFYSPRGEGGPLAALKTAVHVAPGTEVTVSVPRHQQDEVALLYRPGDVEPDGTSATGQRLFRLDQGETRVTFEACPDQREGSIFTGYFLVDGPRCVRLDVRLGNERERVSVPFGVVRC